MQDSARKEPGLPDPNDVRAERDALRREVARLAAELAEAQARASRLESLAREDPLTGLLNRRGFLRDLARAVAYRSRYGTSTAVLIADVDGFKPVNDTYGHAVGDRALAHVAALLRDNLRASDAIGRLGGDEFGVILWHADERAARQKALSLEAIVAGSPLAASGLTLTLGVSIGVASLEPGDGADAVLARADRAMYARKHERKARGRR
ncbi:MAG TPA: GGDEF domain-containing protein [Microvirga sp.]|jgi:diguanylate cyclase (GGDEF)-like protein|nr:GGDEF domain-containing protein [Microvirga sp.]